MRINWQFIRRLLIVCTTVAMAGLAGGLYTQFAIIAVVVGAAAFNMTLGLAEMYWRLYCWWTPKAMANCSWPDPVAADDGRLAFTVALAALHEQHIARTLDSLAQLDYANFEVVAALCACDLETIQKATEVANRYPRKVRLAVCPHGNQHRKAYQLNAAIRSVSAGDNRRVIIADAEGGMHAQILRYMAARFIQTDADVVQGGVQLMNLGTKVRHWYQVFSAMEYKAWFEGNFARQHRDGVVLFGGNTVAFSLAILVKIGGFPDSLTEDGAAGIMTALAGGKVAIAYSPELCTRELSPPTVFRKKEGSLYHQRVRWVQGYVAELLNRRWLRLPTNRQRLSAGYGLAAPVLQSVSTFLLPVAIITALVAKVPIGLSILTFAPLIPYGLAVWAQVMHLADFGRRFGQKISFWHYATLLLLGPLYQIVLMAAAATAVWRHLSGRADWYRTGRGHTPEALRLTSLKGISA